MKELSKVVFIQGAFDVINYGHVRAFAFAKSQGDYLIVGLNTNTLVKDYKRRRPVMPWWQKKKILEGFKHVDKVVKAPDFSPMKLLKKYKVDVYVISREWNWSKMRERAYMKKKGGRVCFSRRFKGISTTAIKLRLLEEYLAETNTEVLTKDNASLSLGYLSDQAAADIRKKFKVRGIKIS